MTNESVLIIGTGAVACLFAARLAAHGIPVKMLGSWQDAVDAIRDKGVRIQEADGSLHSFSVGISSYAEEIGVVERALVLVKSWQTKRAANLLRNCLSDSGIALTLQNGLGNDEILVEILGQPRVTAGIIVLGASLIEPGLVKSSGREEVILSDSPLSESFVKLLEKSGFAVKQTKDIFCMQWVKLLANASINPLSALLDVTNGELLSIPACQSILGKLMRESEDLTEALGLRVPVENLNDYIVGVIKKTQYNQSSMLRDIKRGAPTEIDSITGMLLQHARLASVSIPTHETMYNLIKAKVVKISRDSIQQEDNTGK